jgi:hypothetical protein
MKIVNVELVTDDGVGLAVEPQFRVQFDNDIQGIVPNNPDNRHYWEVKVWYDAQKTKPFDFKFEEMPEPNFAETIYPESEETEEPAESEELPVNEPKTLLPK